ncbi:hypothetical protein HYY70_01140 [Candidatus Woesearchaeota archaeon]|nr:hypothetical protein [Candidatus Woesearchaeota archaeon]
MLGHVTREFFENKRFPSNKDHPQNPIPKIVEAFREHAFITEFPENPNDLTSRVIALFPLNTAQVDISYFRGRRWEADSYVGGGKAEFQYTDGISRDDYQQIREVLVNNGFEPRD